MSPTTGNVKFTDALERDMIVREINFHEHNEVTSTTDMVMKPLLLVIVAVGVPMLTHLMH